MAVVVAAEPAKSSKVEAALHSLQSAIEDEAAATSHRPWQSLCSTKVRWSRKNVHETALFVLRNIPRDALLMLASGSLTPGPLLAFDPNGPVSAEQLSAGSAWVKPFVMCFPEAVPSGYLIADTLLMMDVLLGGALLRNDITTGCRGT